MKSKKNIKKIKQNTKQKRKTRKNKKRYLRFNNRKPLRGGSDEEEKEEEICSICMERISENDWVNNPKITTPCQHSFHINCLHLWCKRIEDQLEREGDEMDPFSFTCPICRGPIRGTCKSANKGRALDSNEEEFLDYLDERRYLDTPPPEDETESEAEFREFWRRDNLTNRIRESRVHWDDDLEHARGMFESERSRLLDSD